MQNAKINAQLALPNEVFTFQCAIRIGAGPFRLWQNPKLHVGDPRNPTKAYAVLSVHTFATKGMLVIFVCTVVACH